MTPTIADETSSTESADVQDTSPTNKPTSGATDQVLNNWEFSMRTDRYVKILQGTLQRETSEIVLAEASIIKTSEGQYKVLIIPHTVKIDDQDLSTSEIRRECLEYAAELDDNMLSFTLESELFAHKDGYAEGLIKPLLCTLTIDQDSNPRTASERQIYQNIQLKDESTREYNLQIYIDFKEVN